MSERQLKLVEDVALPTQGMSAPKEETPGLFEYLRVLGRYRRMIVLLVGAGVGLAMLYVFAKAPVYSADLTLQIEPTSPEYGAVEGVKLTADKETFYQTQYAIIRSRAVAERVVAQLTAEQASILANSPEWFEGFKPPPAPVDKAEVREELIRKVRAGLSVHGLQDSQIVKLEYRGPAPKISAVVANLTAASYIEFQNQARVQITQQAHEWLTSQLEKLRADLEAAEQRLLAYRQEQGLLASEDLEQLTSQKLSSTSQALLNARAALMEAEVLYEQTQSARSGGGPGALVAVLNNPVVQQLKLRQAEAQRQLQSLLTHYGSNAPKVISARAEVQQITQRLQTEVATSVQGIEKRYRAAKAEVARLREMDQSLEANVRERSGETFKLAKLEREVQVNRDLFQTFLSRVKETSLASRLNTNNIRMIDAAVIPGSPVLPNAQRAVGLALVLSVFLGVALAFIRQNLNRTFRTPGDLEARLAIPGIGVLPKLRAREGQDFLKHVVREPRSPFAEAMGEIRTRIQAHDGPTRPQVIMVTSALPGEGKSTLSSNLASAFSQLGTTLLMDADLRRSSLRRLGCKYGLTDLLAGKNSDDCIARDANDPNMYVVGSGSSEVNPQGVLSSAAMGELFTKLRQRFDTIIVDTAPVLAVSDALILGRHCDGVVLAVKAASTPFDVVQDSVRRLRSASVPILGVTLSQVDLNQLLRDGGYAYGHY